MKVAAGISLIAFAVLSLAGCGKGYMDLPPMQFHSLITSNKKVRLLDVRTPEEYRAEHIKGALNIPVADTAAFLASVDSLSHKTPFAVYCRTGKRSDTAARLLSRRGYTVYSLKGGIEAWKFRHLPTRGTEVKEENRPRKKKSQWLEGQLKDIQESKGK